MKTGLLAIFGEAAELKVAAGRVHKLGLTQIDAYTPFPVHGLDKEMGIPKSWASAVTLVMGLSGALFMFFFQYWSLGVDWPMNIAGKPYFAWPAYIPVTFEGGVLVGGVSTVVALVFLCRRTRKYAGGKVLDPRFSMDKFGLFVADSDPRFNRKELEKLLRECHAEEIQTVQ